MLKRVSLAITLAVLAVAPLTSLAVCPTSGCKTTPATGCGTAAVTSPVAGVAANPQPEAHPPVLYPHKSPAEVEARRQAWAKAVNLTPEQQTEVDALRQAYHTQVAEWHDALLEKREDWMTYIHGEKTTQWGLVRRLGEIKNIEAKMELAKVNEMRAVHDLLTPEQQALSKTFWQGVHGGVHGNKHHGGGYYHGKPHQACPVTAPTENVSGTRRKGSGLG
ncbi:MAG: Spy/CpxP family protein refolding chaperone [Vampirovibrionales bacterium]